MMPTTFYDYKIIVELLFYRLGAVHDAVPQATFKQISLRKSVSRQRLKKSRSVRPLRLVCTENLIRVDGVAESPKLAE
jgi:hypothetical protein